MSSEVDELSPEAAAYLHDLRTLSVEELSRKRRSEVLENHIRAQQERRRAERSARRVKP